MLDSHRYGGLSDSAKLLFIHLLLVADDLGCTTITPTFLRRRVFYNQPTNEHIAKLVTELVDVDLIRLYQHEGGEYAFIPRFRQRLQRTTSKHPKPPDSVLYGDDDAIQKFNKINKVNENPTVTQRKITVGQPPEVEVEVEGRGTVSKRVTPLAPSASAFSAGGEVPVEKIPLVNGLEWPVSRAFADELERLYPAVDTLQTLREIRAWNLTHPKNRKTERGIRAHINTWFNKEQNRG